MNLPKISVNRPVTITMFFLGLILLGFISWNRLPQELFPPINYPQITVLTSYEGAAPEEIETLITKIIEEATGTVNNVKRISSTSKEGLSLVMIEFNWGTNMDFASLSVREKIDLIKERLPREAKEPIVMKYNPFDLPIMTVSVTGENKSALELRHTCKKIIKDELEKIEGVASIEITGGLEREILVEIDQPRLMASGISILEVVNSIKMANINYPAGTIKESFYEYLIRTMGEFQTIAEIKDVATAVEEPQEEKERVKPLTPEEEEKIEKKAKRLIYLRDIANIKDTTKERTSISRYNGKENISLSVRKQSGANTVLVAEGIKKVIPKLKQELSGVNLEVVYDQSKFIQASVSSVRDAAVQGSILAFLVLFFFLRRIQPSLIITSAIPISVMAVFSLMLLFGLSLNTISLGGLALGVGMLVDNAIVVLESISLKKGSRKEAVVGGTSEVISAIIGSTFTTIAVFVPTIFVIGIAGQLFKELAFTIVFSLVVSLLMAVSLIPVFASLGKTYIDKVATAEKPIWPGFEGKLSFLLEHHFILIGGVIAVFFISALLLSNVDREFLPRIDQRQFILKVDKPPGTPLEITDTVVKDIERKLFSLREVKEVTVNIGSDKDKPAEEALETLGSNQAQIIVNLKSRKEMRKFRRSRSTNEVVQYLKQQLAKREQQEDMAIEYIAQESFLKTAFGEQAPIILEVKGIDLMRVSSAGEALKKELEKVNGLYGIKTSLVLPSPETKVNIIKDRASLYNLSVRDIALTAQTAIKGYVTTKFKERKEGEEVDIRVRLRESFRRDLASLRNILIYSQLRNLEVPLSEVAYLTRGTGPTQIKRLDQQRAVVVSANASAKRSFNQVRKDVENLIARIQKKSTDYKIVFGGQTQAMKESFNSLRFALILSIALVYMIMAGQFENLWQPFVIMFTMPLSLIGVAIVLLLTHTPISAVVFLGMIMLGGIVVNNGIILIDYANLLIRQQGLSVKDALTQASLRRLRPILMTSLTTILGLTPLALGVGEGSELMAPLAITVIGGLASSTFLTLFVIPAIYLMFEGIFTHPVFAKLKFIRPQEEESIKGTLPILEGDTFRAPEVRVARKVSPSAVTFPESVPSVALNERQAKILELLKEKGRITRAEYAQVFDVSVPTAARDLKELVDKGYLLAQGPLGPGRYYVLKA